jgi:hypothetical protein
LGFQEVEAPRIPRQWAMVRLSAILTGRLYPQESFLVLISVRDPITVHRFITSVLRRRRWLERPKYTWRIILKLILK